MAGIVVVGKAKKMEPTIKFKKRITFKRSTVENLFVLMNQHRAALDYTKEAIQEDIAKLNKKLDNTVKSLVIVKLEELKTVPCYDAHCYACGKETEHEYGDCVPCDLVQKKYDSKKEKE